MDFYQLPFGKIVFLRNDLAEVIMDENVEIDECMVELYHGVLLSHLQAPFSLLVNKINSYAYTFPAQTKLGTLKEINAIAFVSYNSATTITTEILAAIPRENKWNMDIFSNREDALKWLTFEQDFLSPCLSQRKSEPLVYKVAQTPIHY